MLDRNRLPLAAVVRGGTSDDDDDDDDGVDFAMWPDFFFFMLPFFLEPCPVTVPL